MCILIVALMMSVMCLQVKAFLLDQTTFCLYGVDKNQVTQIASNIRRIRPPEPYKGAGIRIVGESIKLKERKIK